MGDKPIYRCHNCRYSSPPFEQGGKTMIECRKDHPGGSGFPVMEADAWCWCGTGDSELISRVYKDINIDDIGDDVILKP